jgi:hypothetical protein
MWKRKSFEAEFRCFDAVAGGNCLVGIYRFTEILTVYHVMRLRRRSRGGELCRNQRQNLSFPDHFPGILILAKTDELRVS